MTETNGSDNHDLNPTPRAAPGAKETDAAGKSLLEALRISFVVLKVIMIVLFVAFLASGFKMVGPDERAIVLRFGKIRGVGDGRVLGPGPHWILPYPIHEMIKIPAEKKVTLPVSSFWYFQTQDEILSKQKRPVQPDQPLSPTRDGYCLTRSEGRDAAVVGPDGSDYNIVHCKWQLTYQIDDVERFFRNVYVEDIKPGEIYFDSMTKSISPLLQYLVEDAVVAAMVNYTIDEALESRDRIQQHVRRILDKKLEDIDSGVKVVSVYPIDITYPRQVAGAFEQGVSVSQQSQGQITQARTQAEGILNEAAGPVAERLVDALHDPNVSEQEQDMLWGQAAGAAGEKIAQARAYRTEVVETAKARAEYMMHLLPEYRKYPTLVIQRIYQDAVEYVFKNAAEKFIAPPGQAGKAREIRIQANRNPAQGTTSDAARTKAREQNAGAQTK